MATYHTCKECEIHHYDNCATCFGFGVYKEPTSDGYIPVTAGDAHSGKFNREWIPCPECGSTPEGISE